MEDIAVANKPNKTFLTSGEVGKLLGFTSYWVNVLIAKGQLDTHRIGVKGWHRVSVAALEKYAAQRGIPLDWSLIEPKLEMRQ